MNIKIIFFSLFVTTSNVSPILAAVGNCHGNKIFQIEKPIDKKIVDSTEKKSPGIEIKKNTDQFLTAFGRLFAPEKNKRHDTKKQTDPNKVADLSGSMSAPKSVREVFGFYPYWLDDAVETYDYKLLSSIAYFGYDLDPYTGKYKYIKAWKTTKLIDAAKANNTKVYLTVTSLSENNNKIFLDDNKSAEAAREKSINTILQLLNDREAHGAVIYFEDVPCEHRDHYTNYIRALSKRLKQFKKTVVVVLPAVDSNGCYDVMAIDADVEYFVVLAEDYYGSWSDVAGPVAPLHGGTLWTQGNLENTIEDYLSEGVPKNKMIISLPFYGNKWETEDDNVPTFTKAYLGKLTFRDIRKHYKQKVYFDPESQTKYLNFKQGKKFIQVWFDDIRSLEKKYDFINTEQLAGVGIWALGDNDGKAEIWKILDSKFTQGKGFTPAKKPPTFTSMLKKKGVLKGILWVAAIILIFGFLLSLRHAEIRDIVFTGSLMKNVILFGIPIILSTVIYLLSENKMWSVMVFLVILSGYALYGILVRPGQHINNQNRIP